MESGEKELRLAFEEVTTNNVKAVIEYSSETRKLVRDLESKIESLDNLIRNYDTTIDLLKQQIVHLQMKMFSGGTQ